MKNTDSLADEIKEQRSEVLRERTLGQKLSYLAFYYKYHLIIAAIVICVITYVVSTVLTNKQPYLQIACVNANSEVDFDEVLAEYDATLQYDRDKLSTYMDASYVIANDNQNGFDSNQIQKIFYSTAANRIDVIVADEVNFMWMASNGYFKNLDLALSPEEKEKYADKLLACKVTSNGQEYDEISGIEVELASKVAQGNWYPQGKAYIGIVMETDRIDESIDFIDYLFEE
ncbi:MAG: hypothetical protein KBT19_00685 [Lachnospiraceae bacterium]|nr:hypothetical protein [Candidatus Colinaster equi]